jgi:DNA-binding CsgD family transcriptional regulator
MGAIDHLKTLCCLGLPRESAMIAVVPLLHEIIPHGTTRIGVLEPDGTLVGGYAEHPDTAAIYRERFWRFLINPSGPALVLKNEALAVGIGWLLHLQGRGWLDTAWYREMEAPLDSCWVLEAMIGEGGRTFARMGVARPRSARRFTADDVERIDRLRPWLAHAFRPSPGPLGAAPGTQDLVGAVGAPVLSGEVILTSDAKIAFQAPNFEHLLISLTGQVTRRHAPARDMLPAPILKLLQRILGATNGSSDTPPRMQISTVYGIVTLEAKWLVPAGAIPADVAKDPKSCLIAVTIELREHLVAHAAQILRKSGATPAQVKVGVRLALGKGKPEIADQLGIKVSSVRDLTEKLYQTLDVHNAAELGAKIWPNTGQQQNFGAGFRC